MAAVIGNGSAKNCAVVQGFHLEDRARQNFVLGRLAAHHLLQIHRSDDGFIHHGQNGFIDGGGL